MAAGFDELIDFLLSEIALCGTQGASWADFQRFIQKYYLGDNPLSPKDDSIRGFPQGGPGRTFYEKVWQWVTTHSDIRIIHNNQARQYSLADFEAAEKAESVRPDGMSNNNLASFTSVPQKLQPAKPLLALRAALQQRLSAEKQDARKQKYSSQPASCSALPDRGCDADSQTVAARCQPRVHAESNRIFGAAFDEPTSSTSAPRLFASQNRIWQALTGHSMDLKKVPTMEFALLSIIATHGVDGITQPDLVQFSGQDKRSVPHRTDELARKGYIVKNPVQAGKARTSLCVHTKFVSQNHFTTSGAVEDAFRLGTFVASSFVPLLYNTFKDAGVVLTRDLRKRMGVPIQTWNKRAVHGALIRLDQSGMIRRFQVRKHETEDIWITCIQIQREPCPEDLENLGFRRQAPIADTSDEQLQDDDDGETFMRDIEVDLLEEGDDNDDNNNNLDETARIPPQWTPDRLLGNAIFEFTALGQTPGWDALVLRDRVVGPYWRRPFESYLTRLTDDWERMQPAHLRHLAIIRDTRTSDEKRFVHYVYRTYRHFQQAVRAGEADWGGVCKPVSKSDAKSSQKKRVNDDVILNPWGFYGYDQKEFVRFNGTATLSDVRSAIAGPRKYGPRWDISVAKAIGYDRANPPLPKIKAPRCPKKATTGPKGSRDSLLDNNNPEAGNSDEADDSDEQNTTLSVLRKSRTSKTKKKGSGLTLTPEQRVSLGLKSSGRLSKNAAKQILAHRRETGDPESLPDKLIDEPVIRGKAPLMTKEERIAENLPLKGRLGLDKENEIREKRGLPKLVEKVRKKRGTKEPAILTKQQRIMLGFKDHGRLHQWFMDDLRREQDNNISLEHSPAVTKYREFLKAEETKVGARSAKATTPAQTTPVRGQTPIVEQQTHGDEQPSTTGPALSHTATTDKRKASDLSQSPTATKRIRTKSSVSRDDADSTRESQAEIIIHHGTPQLPDSLPFEGPAALDESEEAPRPSLDSTEATSEIARPVPDHASIDNSLGNIERTSPGLYLFLSAKRKVSRGRPRNALVAVFRTYRLAELPWFTKELSSELHSTTIVSMGPCKPAAKQNTVLDESVAIVDSAGLEGLPLQLRTPVETRLSSESRANNTTRPELVSDSIAQRAEDAEHQERLDERGQALSRSPNGVLSEPELRVRAQVSSSQPVEDDLGSQQEHGTPTLKSQPSPPSGLRAIEESLMPNAVPDLNVTNASTQVTRPSYQSPYAQIEATASVQQAVAANIARLPTMRMEVHGVDTRSPPALPQGVIGEVLEQEDAEIAAYRKALEKSAAPAAVGSALKFRREIILDILERCNGVYPLHGEIGRPFRALWNLRHGHTSLRVPENSTVHDTLKNMISNPAFGLKRMAFQVKARNATGRKLRAIVARSDIAHNDPRVLKLAYNMANHSTEKANQFFPEEIRDVFEYETMYVPPPVAPKDDSFTLAQMFPEIEYSIKENKIRRRKEKAAQRTAEKAAAKKQNEQVEKVMPKRRARAQVQNIQAQNLTREKRTRLASLNDKNKRYRRAPVQIGILDDMEEEARQAEVQEPSPTGTDSSENVPLKSLRPWQTSLITENGASDDEGVLPFSADDRDVEMNDSFAIHALDLEFSFTHPVIRFQPTTGTFSTHFDIIAPSDDRTSLNATEAVDPDSVIEGTAVPSMISILYPLVRFHATTGTFATFFGHLTLESGLSHETTAAIRKAKSSTKTKKRVRIHDPSTERLSKRIRRSTVSQKEMLDDEFVYSSTEDSDVTSSEDEEEDPRPTQKQKQKRNRRASSKRQLGKNLPTPTLLERLTGLTGDPNDPIYKDPKMRLGSGSGQSWAERKKKQFNKQRKEREYAETLDRADLFRKLCLTLALASSMSGEDGVVNWSILEKVYARDIFFDLSKTKKLWAWMQIHMPSQLVELIDTLQSNFLAAYNAGRLPAIENPETYDWGGLVRWAMRTCAYPELPLPLHREAIAKFVVDESDYAALDRVTWYGKKLADTGRTQLQLQLPFVVPIHGPCGRISPSIDNETKARSWIRANIATPQSIYDAHLAHEKLKVMGEDVLSGVVGDFVQQEHLKMRKLKRQLPGRNYTFTKKFAKNYKRPFELEDFMVATTVKKELDAAFASEDSKERIYSISRCEEDGSIMAIMSLVADGKVKLAPYLPPVNNAFGAPLPRLSKWGFCEGDYVHRSIDRNRMFWDTHVVPTSEYQFGNPLQPLPSPSADWPSLPEPPLPGKHDGDALLPIWSSIDGQLVTWPWWYRILNLVLQPLFLQPGATATDIYSHCPEHTTEIFEVQLVLDWLESVNAVSKTLRGGYQVTLHFWAAFGDRLFDVEDDVFGQHVKRHTKMTTKQQWRDKYNLRYSKMQMQRKQGRDQHTSGQAPGIDAEMSHQIIHNSRAQYGILQQAMLDPPLDPPVQVTRYAHAEETPEPQADEMEDILGQVEQTSTPAIVEEPFVPHTPKNVHADVEMGDVDVAGQEEDQEGEMEDVDAEGEVDDEMY